MKQQFTCYLRIMSPVHIGCDEVYEPTGFVINEKARQLIAFDSFGFISALESSEKQRFSEICKKGTISSILEIYHFFREKTANGKEVPVCGDMIKHYQQTLALPSDNESKIQQELNGFRIERTSFLAYNGCPYIPGSSLKGALRTAYLNGQAIRQKPNINIRQKYAEQDLEKSLLNAQKIENDPFRMVRISDFMPVGEPRLRIVYAVNEKKESSKFQAKGTYQILEVIEAGTMFAGEITVEEPPKGSPIRSPISSDYMFEDAKAFYAKEKTREIEELKHIGITAASGISEPNTIPIRIGRHSGAESLTVDGYRNIKIMLGKGKEARYDDHATTFWLASEARRPESKTGLRPFGWAELILVTPEQIRLQKQAEEIVREKERHKAALEAMTPEERDIAMLKDPSVQENSVFEIFGRIDRFPEEQKKELAAALKSYWESHGKWNKKACSAKQWVKVGKVKQILGES